MGEYCRRAKLVVPKEVELALAEADACAEEEADEAAAAATASTGRPASQTPIPQFDVAALLAIFAAPIGDEEANGQVRRVELPAGASAAQCAAHKATYVDNTATGHREHKQTLMTREQHMDIDDKAAPGRLRYVQGSRMAIISEDKGVGTGFWHGRIYQVHCARSTESSLPTKAGPLLLEGVLEVGYARLLEIRKGVGKASVQHPRLSVKCEDATSCEGVLMPMVLASDGTLSEDLSQPPMLVPLALLGCEVAAEQVHAGDACTGASFQMGELVEAHGGAPLHGMVLTESMFAAAKMVAGGEVAFEAMTVDQLKVELAERGSTRSGRKAILQRRLHALIVQSAIKQSAGDDMDV